MRKVCEPPYSRGTALHATQQTLHSARAFQNEMRETRRREDFRGIAITQAVSGLHYDDVTHGRLAVASNGSWNETLVSSALCDCD